MDNLGLIVQIQISPWLHTPMYFFLNHLASVDFSVTSSVTLSTLVHCLFEAKCITVYSCAIQVFCIIKFAVWELWLLAVMAYNQNVAICNPLLYVILVPRNFCYGMIVGTYIYGFSMGLVQTVAKSHLSFCGSCSQPLLLGWCSLDCFSLFWHSYQRADVTNDCCVQYTLLSTDCDNSLSLHPVCRSEDPFCWRKIGSFFLPVLLSWTPSQYFKEQSFLGTYCPIQAIVWTQINVFPCFTC